MKPANYHVATVWVQMTPGNTSALSPLTLRKRGTDYRASDVPTPGRPFPSNRMQKRRAILSFLAAPGPGLPHRHSSPARLAGSLLSTHFRACRQFLSPATSAQVTEASWVLGSFFTFSPSQAGSCVSETEGESRSFSSLFCPKEEHWVQQTVLGLSTEGTKRSSSRPQAEVRPSRFHFLKGVSLLKVCQNSEGFRLGSARANTCC